MLITHMAFRDRMQKNQLTRAWAKGAKFENEVFICIHLNTNDNFLFRISLRFAA